MQLLLQFKLLSVITILSLIISLGLRTYIPVLIGDFMDRVILSQNSSLFTDLIVAILVISLLSVLFNYIMTYCFVLLSWNVKKKVRELFFNTIQNKPLKFHDNVRSGEFMALATIDVNFLTAMIFPGIRMIAEVLLTLSFFIIFGLMQNVELALILTPFLLVYIWAVIVFNRKLISPSEFQERRRNLMAIAAQDNITGARIVRAFNGEEHENEHFREAVKSFKDTYRERELIQARFWPLLITYITVGFSFFAGMIMVYYGSLTIGQLIAFNGMIFLLVQPTNIINFAINAFQMGLASGGRIYRFMNFEGDETKDQTFPFDFTQIRGSIEFKNVSFSYPNSSKPALRNINLQINPGETVAIVGASGSGKTTLTKLLLRLYDDYEGKIFLDEIDTKLLPLTKLRQNIGNVEQDVFIFATSIKNNILFGVDPSSKTEGDVLEAATLAQAHEFITTMPKQYESIVGERGIGLSGGQKQRIALARCFILNPKILILDDSTSAIDSATEEKISQAIANITKDRTTLLITHRISSIIRADKIVFLKNGTVLACGTHQELYNSIPDYQRIFDTRRKYLAPMLTKQVQSEPDQIVGGM